MKPIAAATIRAAVFLVSAPLLGLTPVKADIISSEASHYHLHHEATSALPVTRMWERLIHPETWWSDAHTFSGSAANLKLTPRAGASWEETWSGGSVEHGRILTVVENQMLRLEAPFGPLQGMGVRVIWTITLSSTPEGGSRIIFDEVATGAPASKLDQVAGAVDGVKQQALKNLASPVEN